MKDVDCVQFLQWVLPRLRMRWPGFRKVRRQVCKRIDRRLRELRLANLSAYRDYLNHQSREWLVLDGLCRISISRFYRDRRVFDLIRNEALPQLAAAAKARGDSNIRGWSAGCASGEEVYTLKMVWEFDVQQRFPGISLQIVATDADPQMLRRAQCGCYTPSSVKDVPEEWMQLAFSISGEELQVGDLLRGGIEILRQDIRREQPAGPFDLVCCRHLVFTYFDEKLQEEVLARMMAQLRPDGILVIGKQEQLPPQANYDLRLVRPHSGIYQWHSGPKTSR